MSEDAVLSNFILFPKKGELHIPSVLRLRLYYLPAEVKLKCYNLIAAFCSCGCILHYDLKRIWVLGVFLFVFLIIIIIIIHQNKI